MHIDCTKIDINIVKTELIEEWIVSTLVLKKNTEIFTYDDRRRFFHVKR